MAVLDLNDNYGYEDASLFWGANCVSTLSELLSVARGNQRALRHAEGQAVRGERC